MDTLAYCVCIDIISAGRRGSGWCERPRREGVGGHGVQRTPLVEAQHRRFFDVAHGVQRSRNPFCGVMHAIVAVHACVCDVCALEMLCERELIFEARVGAFQVLFLLSPPFLSPPFSLSSWIRMISSVVLTLLVDSNDFITIISCTCVRLCMNVFQCTCVFASHGDTAAVNCDPNQS